LTGQINTALRLVNVAWRAV